MALPDGIERVEMDSEAALWAWLDAHHDRAESVLLVTWKAAHPARYLSRDQVLDALVAYGWIDGRRYVVDDSRTAQLVGPRKVQHWAQSYKTRAARLIAEGRMQPAGHASIASGKASGLWDFMADVDALIVPDDLDAVLGGARVQWDALAPSYRRNLLRWIKLAKTAQTRRTRLETVGQSVREGRRLPQM